MTPVKTNGILKAGDRAKAIGIILALVMTLSGVLFGAFRFGVTYATADIRTISAENAADIADHLGSHNAVLDLLYLIEERQRWQIIAERSEYEGPEWRRAMQKLEDLSARIPRTD